MKKQEREKQRIIDALRILMHLRWFWAAAIVVIGPFSKLVPGIQGNANFPIVYMIIMASINPVASNILGMYYIRRSLNRLSIRGLRVLAAGQILLDYIVMIFIMYYAGGIMSIGFVWMIINIVAAGYLYSFWGVIRTASLAAVMYISMLTLQFFSIIPYYPRYNLPCEPLLAHNPQSVIINSWLVSSTFIIIAVFSGLMARNLRNKENEILEEQDKKEAILSNLVDGLIYIDKKDLIDIVNPQAEKLLGVDSQKLKGKNVVQLNYEKLKMFKRVLGFPDGKVHDFSPKEKTDVNLEVRSFNVKNQDGEYIGRVTLLRDVSREKFMEQMKSEFITIAGHQLRTPLSAIKGALYLLVSGDIKDKKEQQEMLKHSYEYTERLIVLVNDLLNASSVEEGRFDYHFEKIDVTDLLSAVINKYKEQAEAKSIFLKLFVKNNLSDVVLDSEKIKLSVGAIIDNALTYTPKHGNVEVSCAFSKDDTVVVSIKDTGIGIPKDQHKKMFSKFFRADNALRVDTEGNGLDLFVARNIIEKHKGKIWFESSEGVGTTFYIEIPVKQKTDSRKQTADNSSVAG